MHPTHALIAAALALGTTAALAQALKVENAWARPTVQGQGAGGGFLRIVGGAAGDRLLAARAGVAGAVELHSMSMEGDVMRMRQIDAIDVPAGKTVDLAPGGLHLMFTGLKAPLAIGSSFPLALRFEKAGELKVDVRVQATAPGGMAAMPGGHVHGQKHDQKHDKKPDAKHEHKH